MISFFTFSDQLLGQMSRNSSGEGGKRGGGGVIRGREVIFLLIFESIPLKSNYGKQRGPRLAKREFGWGESVKGNGLGGKGPEQGATPLLEVGWAKTAIVLPQTSNFNTCHNSLRIISTFCTTYRLHFNIFITPSRVWGRYMRIPTPRSFRRVS